MDSFNSKVEQLKKLREEEQRVNIILAQLTEAANKRQKIMTALHDYNDIKDATQVVLGRLADLHGVTVSKLHIQYNLPTDS